MNDPRGSNWRKWDLQAQTIQDGNYISLDQYYEQLKEEQPAKWQAFSEKVGGEKKAIKYDSKSYFGDRTIIKKDRCVNYTRTLFAFIDTFRPDLDCIGITDHNYFDEQLLDTFIEYSRGSRCKIIPGCEINASGVHILAFFPEILYNKDTFSKGIHTFLAKINIHSCCNDGVLITTSYDPKGIIDIINDKKGIVIFPHCNSNNGLFQERGRTDRTHLADIFNHQTIDLLQSQNKHSCEQVKEYINSNSTLTSKSCSLISSDSRALKDIGKSDNEGNFLWIKADPTFEGFRQIIYEPDERVKIQKERPEQKSDYQVIDSIEIDHKDFFKQTILLNQNLNAIIGGRSSGKSLLLGSMAKKIGTTRHVKSNNFKYEDYIDNQLVLNITLKWKDDVEDTSHSVEYFPQSYINGLAAESDEVNKLLERIVKNDIKKKSGIDNYNNFCIENKSSRNQKVGNFFALRQKALDKKQEIIDQGSKEGVEKQIKKWKKELKIIKGDIESEITEPEEAEYKKLQDEIAAKQKQIEDSKKTVLQLADLKLLKIFNPIENELISIDDSLRPQISQAYKLLCQTFETQWAEKIEQFSKTEQGRISANDALIKKIKDDELFIKCKEHFGRNMAYLDLEEKLKLEEEKLVVIIGLEKELTTINEKQKVEIASILLSNKEYYQKANELTDKLSFSKADVEIAATPYFRDLDFKNSMRMRFDQRTHANITDYQNDGNEGFVTFMQELFDKLINNEIQFKGSYMLQQVLIDVFAENFYEIRYDVRFQQDNLSDMSEGKKAFIILRILLDFNEKQCPILIDQPEDDLDNRAIYDELVKYIRNKKKERQIILVTHNPNIVVGADAEEVIVANQDGIGTANQSNVKFEYFSGSLENVKEKDDTLPILVGQGIKQHVCDILEGGIEAFGKREDKYNLKR